MIQVPTRGLAGDHAPVDITAFRLMFAYPPFPATIFSVFPPTNGFN